MASDDIIRWGELTLKSGVVMSDDPDTVDVTLDVDDFQFWFEPHPEFPNTMRITINLSGGQWNDLKDAALVKERSGQKAYTPAALGEDGIDRVLLREPPDEFVWHVGAAVYAEDLQPEDNSAFLTAARTADKHEGDCVDIPATCLLCEADKVRGLGKAALAAIASYIEEHARSEPISVRKDSLHTQDAPTDEPTRQELIDRATKAEAEVERLNTWADGFSDAQLKERRLCEELLRERAAQIKELIEALERMVAGLGNAPSAYKSGWLAELQSARSVLSRARPRP